MRCIGRRFIAVAGGGASFRSQTSPLDPQDVTFRNTKTENLEHHVHTKYSLNLQHFNTSKYNDL